ncbi:PD-(D/E)XK nuclease family protein [Mycobacterium sp. 663a-19]|uniref:PD-(D/E)XK nuclease family protein n=1 Tax=Mycobacterium sp. 663a-19 TaxID=2986148 RepID=UPI002D1F2E49|nr:PD-(D/E)XK nuclease family protein [Mycobacterium sp. 663a-19]MEB3982525.1 PD-(D/E)XK nuclease family protein [Mycobacterium sp. 663a-19]
MLSPPRPHPRLIDRITPTALSGLTKCFWRVGFRRDPAMSSLDRWSPAGALGTVAHSVKRQFGDPRGFEATWDAAVATAQARLAAEWAPATPPSPDNWPGWSLTKTRIRKAWLGSKSGPVARTAAAKDGFLPPLPWREIQLNHPSLPLAGQPDLVERVNGKIWVVDTKTGLSQANPSSDQRDQLLIYCALVQANLGEMPAVAAIETSRCERYPFAVDPNEVKRLVERAVDMLDRFNSAADSFDESLASPSTEACGWCPFRIACQPFFQAYDETWEISHAVLFTVESADVREHGAHVEGVVQLPLWRTGQKFASTGFPFQPLPAAGETWAAADYVGSGSSAVAAWNTTTFKWS